MLTPNLIFLERHNDYIATRVLLELYRLLDNHYKLFLDETTFVSISSALEESNKTVNYYRKKHQDFFDNLDKMGIDTFDPEKIINYLNNTVLPKLEQNDKNKELVIGVRRYTACLSHLNLLAYLDKNNLFYKGIYDEQVVDILREAKEKSKATLSDMLKETLPTVNDHMLKEYFNAQQPFFAVTGGKHADGLQKGIIERLGGIDKAKNDFLFVYVHSLPVVPYHSELKALPIPILEIDAADKNIVETTTIIVIELMKRMHPSIIPAILLNAMQKEYFALSATIISQFKFDVNFTDKLGHTPLMLAALKKQTNLIDLLIKNGANLDAQNNQGSTALHFAADKGDTNSVKRLVAGGANVAIRTQAGNTPALKAIQKGHLDVLKLLLAHPLSKEDYVSYLTAANSYDQDEITNFLQTLNRSWSVKEPRLFREKKQPTSSHSPQQKGGSFNKKI